jgi:hypothetical protein
LARAESSVPFNVAVKHLFRHLHDARTLRNNPIVGNVFKETSIGLARVREERGAIAQIHELVRQSAKHCYDIDVASGKGERALRQHAIITLQCLEQRPIREVAEALGISYYHCYRERANICRRVAHYIGELNQSPALEYVPELDEFRFLVDHTRNRATFIDEPDALRACDEVVRAASSTLQKIEDFRTGGLVSIQFGSPAWAEAAREAVMALIAEELVSAPPAERDVALAYVDLLGYSLANHRGETVEALRLAQRVTARLEPHQARAAASVRELYTESLFNLGVALWSLGNTDMGYDCLTRAEASLQYTPAAWFPFRTRITASMWKLRNYLSMNCKSWYPSWQRLKGLATAFEQAYASGSLSEAVEALVVITEHHVFAGDDDEALRTGRFALLLAKRQPSESLRIQTPIEIGARLLSTRHWHFASSLILCVDRPEALNAYHRELLAYSAAERALRLREFQSAWTLANDDGHYGRWATLTVRRQLVAAAAAHGLERGREARDLIDSAVPAAERLHSAPILRDAYRLAGRITGDSRFRRKASEVARLLTG